jgi:hypothetical protein
MQINSNNCRPLVLVKEIKIYITIFPDLLLLLQDFVITDFDAGKEAAIRREPKKKYQIPTLLLFFSPLQAFFGRAGWGGKQYWGLSSGP